MDQLGVDHPGRSFCFILDNMNVRHSKILLVRYEEKGHVYLFWAPYWSMGGQMEYIFNSGHFLIDAFQGRQRFG